MEFTADQLARMTDRALSAVSFVVIHHTADPSMNKDITEIAREEIASQGFVSVGYHAVIHGDGKVQYGRPMGKVPAANLGLNTVSYAIALEGNFEPGSPGYCGQQPTTAQLKTVVALVENVKKKLPHLNFLIGHLDVARIVGVPGDATACPGKSLQALLPHLRAETGLHAA
jgi:N-acetyl-anhydromuramyl-L-alanine amidase AmpD